MLSLVPAAIQRTKGQTRMLPTSTQLANRRVIAVASDKGGVFKTSTVANVAGLLASADYRVLVIDFDPQGNLGRTWVARLRATMAKASTER